VQDLAVNVESLWQGIQAYVLDKGIDLVGAVLVLLAGWMIGRWARKRLAAAVRRSPIDDTLASFFGGMAYVGILLIAVIAAASVLGVPLAPAVAIFGAVGLAVALAFQGTLSNFASGVLLLTFRPFRVGDVVEIAGNVGKVTELGLFFCHMTTGDNVRIIVPNNEISGKTIKNLTANETRRIDLVVGVSYDDDLGVAIETVHQVLSGDERVLEEPAPTVAVSEMADSSVNLVVRPWVSTGEYWPARFDLLRALKERLEAAGCSIPYPQRDVHLFGEGGGDGTAEGSRAPDTAA
jgi:small conductance mechanosensitive channel